MATSVWSFIKRQKRQKKPGGCTYTLIENGSIVLSRPYGYITKEVLESILKRNIYYANQLKKQNKPALILTDLAKITGVSPGVRHATAEIHHLASEKSALYGANAFITLIAKYIIRLSRVDGNTHIFRTRIQAMLWLQGKNKFPRLQVARLAAITIAVMGAAVVAGWYLGIDALRSLGPFDPINPVVGANFIVAGICLTILTLQKTLWKDIAVLVGAGWLVVFGVLVGVRSRFGIYIPIDVWTLPAGFRVGAAPCPELIAYLIAFAGGMIWLATTPIMHRLTSWMFRGLMAGSAVTIIVLMIAFGLDLSGARLLSILVILLGIDAVLVLVTYRSPGRFPFARKIMSRYGEGIGLFVVIAIVTLFAWHRALQFEEAETLNRTADVVTTEINSNVDVLRGYKAFLKSSVFVEASEFDSYFAGSGLRESNPGIVSVGLLRNVSSPSGSSYPITYVTPMSDAANYGVNYGADPETRQLLERARDSGQIVSSDNVSGHAPLVKGAALHELLIVAPLYTAKNEPTTTFEKQKQLYGFVVAEFDHAAFFSSFFNDFPTNKNIPLVVTDVQDNRMLYRSSAAVANRGEVVANRVITVAGHSWSIGILRPNFGEGGVFFGPNIVLLAGVALALLTSSLVATLVRRRQAVSELADAVTDDLEAERNQALQIARTDDTIIADIGDALIAIDAQGRITLTNNRFTELLGWKSDEVIGRDVYEVLVATDAQGRFIPRGQRAVTRSLRDNVKVTVSLVDGLQYKRKDGSMFPAAWTISPIEVDGKVTGAIEIIRDISQESEIDQAKTQFISLASHQLRTPLTAAKWYTELLLEGEVGSLKPAQAKYVQKVHAATIRTIDLVSFLLNLSRIEMRSIMVEPEPTDIAKLARDIVKVMTRQAKGRKIVIHENYSASPLMVKIDPSVMHTMMDNLLSNAIKYSPEGMTVTLAITADKHGTLISVKDTGYGIPKWQQDKVFTKLFRADNITKRDTHGTGLGLALVKGLADYSGGEVWFESVENEGSTFYIRIPPSGMRKRRGVNQVILVK